ncbi:hypothetical protein EUGRSUZ_F00481 [Eucalyptus grandis]|uniref:Uncharacterized protein n=2 Tax=Eucalyptus grandis TaxID=71139 RepID=A0A059BLF6_EUCGR|nr:hypothetical protein EUGRSUZ_F00481 [Eucalyptus grandis]
MDNYLKENFGDVKAKNSSEEALQRWRKACWLVKNPKRRFRFTANLSKRSEADAIRHTFKAGLSDYKVPENVEAAGFQICAEELESIDEADDEKKLRSHEEKPVIRNGLRRKLSTYDLLPGDILHLNIGDQVPADGLFISGGSLLINLFSLTGDSKPVHASGVGIPFLLPGKEVQYLITQDACDPCSNDSACASDDLICLLVRDLDSCCLDKQKQAALKIRCLTKNKPENRVRIARAGAIKPLITLISSSDPEVQEYSVTAILNLSLCDENKKMIAAYGAIKPLVRALREGTSTVKENAACALLHLSQIEENKVAIGRSGAIPLLVNLLERGGSRGKEDACTALYLLCSAQENKGRAVQAGVMQPLVGLMADLGSSMVEMAVSVVSRLLGAVEARVALVEEEGIPVLVELVEVGTQRQKEIAVGVLLQLCEDSIEYRTKVGLAGAVPLLMALAQSGANRRKQKVRHPI